jgi:hypothetical protein
MLCNKQLSESDNNSFVVYQQQVEQPEHLLEESEHQLATFKNSLADLSAEYLSDLAIVKQEAKDLGEQVKEREEKHFKLEREHQKRLKTTHDLRQLFFNYCLLKICFPEHEIH